MRMFQRVVIKKRSELMVTLIIIGILLLFTSCAIYFLERDALNTKFTSIPEAMWWSIITLTTVGYGDTHPVTGFGQLLAGFVAVLGIGMFALPTSILGAAFLEEMEKKKLTKPGGATASDPHPQNCPHCGEEL